LKGCDHNRRREKGTRSGKAIGRPKVPADKIAAVWAALVAGNGCAASARTEQLTGQWFGNARVRMKIKRRVGTLNLNAVAKRVSSLPPRLLDVLACLSEGMSNSQIAAELGYKNASSVATVIHETTKRLGLLEVYSRIEKRQLSAEAFRKATLRTVKIKLNKI
jgi:DNA-binding NarL/FixJ family response regulator